MTDGKAEEAPGWYLLIQSAKYLRVAVWELAERPVYWHHIAQEAMAAEEAARKAKDTPKKKG